MFPRSPSDCLAVFARLRARRLGAVVLGLLLVLSLGASARARRRRKTPPREPEAPLALKLEGFDRSRGQVVVLVSGLTRAPEARLFAFHDDRERHFIALAAACVSAEGGLRCTLDLPRFYLKHSHVVGMTAHLRGREIPADADAVAALFGAGSASPDAPADGGVQTVDGTEIGWELRGDAGWHEEDEADDVDTEEWRYLKQRR